MIENTFSNVPEDVAEDLSEEEPRKMPEEIAGLLLRFPLLVQDQLDVLRHPAFAGTCRSRPVARYSGGCGAPGGTRHNLYNRSLQSGSAR